MLVSKNTIQIMATFNRIYNFQVMLLTLVYKVVPKLRLTHLEIILAPVSNSLKLHYNEILHFSIVTTVI